MRKLDSDILVPLIVVVCPTARERIRSRWEPIACDILLNKKKTFCWKQRRGAKRRVESHRHRGQRLQQSLPQKWMRKQISASSHWVNRLCVISQRVADKKRRWWVPFLVYLLRVCLQPPLPPLLSSLCFFFFCEMRWGDDVRPLAKRFS